MVRQPLRVSYVFDEPDNPPEEEIHEAALSDLDFPPFTEDEIKQLVQINPLLGTLRERKKPPIGGLNDAMGCSEGKGW